MKKFKGEKMAESNKTSSDYYKTSSFLFLNGLILMLQSSAIKKQLNDILVKIRIIF